jgi:hypothetical protein
MAELRGHGSGKDLGVRTWLYRQRRARADTLKAVLSEDGREPKMPLRRGGYDTRPLGQTAQEMCKGPPEVLEELEPT